MQSRYSKSQMMSLVRRCPSRNKPWAAPALADVLPAERGRGHCTQLPHSKEEEKNSRRLHKTHTHPKKNPSQPKTNHPPKTQTTLTLLGTLALGFCSWKPKAGAAFLWGQCEQLGEEQVGDARHLSPEASQVHVQNWSPQKKHKGLSPAQTEEPHCH